MEKAIETGYYCKIGRPSTEENRKHEEALARYQLSEIYEELGQKERAISEYKHSHRIFRDIFSDRYTDAIAQKLFSNASLRGKRKRLSEQ